MLSRKMYDYLNKRIFTEGNEKFVCPYEVILDYYKQMQDISSNPEILEKIDDDILNMVELYCMYYGILGLSIAPDTETKNFKKQTLFFSMFSTIANSIMSVMYLVKNGLEYQANVIMRQLFELCMVLLNVGIDKEKAIILMNTEMIEENMQVWRKYFSPKALNDTLDKYEGEELNLTEWRKKKYSEYSNYTHNHFFSFWIFSYSRACTEDELMKLNIWGSYVSRGNNILMSMIDFLWYTNKVLINIIENEDTYISKDDLVKDKEFWNFSMYLFCILDIYYIYYLEKELHKV